MPEDVWGRDEWREELESDLEYVEFNGEFGGINEENVGLGLGGTSSPIVGVNTPLWTDSRLLDWERFPFSARSCSLLQ